MLNEVVFIKANTVSVREVSPLGMDTGHTHKQNSQHKNLLPQRGKKGGWKRLQRQTKASNFFFQNWVFKDKKKGGGLC